jgi:hypothetical protein
LRNYAAAQPKSSNFPAKSAELLDALNLLSANSYDQNAAGWRKPGILTHAPFFSLPMNRMRKSLKINRGAFCRFKGAMRVFVRGILSSLKEESSSVGYCTTANSHKIRSKIEKRQTV